MQFSFSFPTRFSQRQLVLIGQGSMFAYSLHSNARIHKLITNFLFLCLQFLLYTYNIFANMSVYFIGKHTCKMYSIHMQKYRLSKQVPTESREKNLFLCEHKHTEEQGVLLASAPGPVLDFGPERGPGKGTVADLGPLIRHLVSTRLPSGGRAAFLSPLSPLYGTRPCV